MKICIGLPTPDRVSSNFSLYNLPQIIATAKAQMPDLELFQLPKTGVMTSSNRNFIVNEAMKIGVDAILWLDVDMIYPIDIIKTLWDANVDVIGSVYFKRSEPYDPVVYIKSKNKDFPYGIIDPLSLQQVTEVDGIGFGGMMVRSSVYKRMISEGKWHRYGRNFGIPTKSTDRLSHDLQFCKEVQRLGFKIWVHPRVRCGHLEERLITYEDWKPKEVRLLQYPKIAVLLPSINVDKASMVIKQMQERASYPAEYYILEDKKRSGFMKTINTAVKKIEADYYVYTAEDAYVGKNWLYYGIYEMLKKNSVLLAFNDGKNAGTLATFGMVKGDWMKKNYEGNLFFPGYHSHYGDTELTMLALGEKKLSYNPESIMIEVDYNKHGVNIDDKKLYNIRKKSFRNVPDLFA